MTNAAQAGQAWTVTPVTELLGSGGYGTVEGITCVRSAAAGALAFAVKRAAYWRRHSSLVPIPPAGKALPWLADEEGNVLESSLGATADELYETLCTEPHEMLMEATALRLVGRLEAPSFPRFHGACSMPVEGYPPEDVAEAVLVMEWARKGTLAAAATAVPAPSRTDVRGWMFQLLWSLMVMHIQTGLLHRDIKDANIVFRRSADAEGAARDAASRDAGAGAGAVLKHFTLRQRPRLTEGTPGWTMEWELLEAPTAKTPLLVDFGLAGYAAPALAASRDAASDDNRALASLPSPDLWWWRDGARRGYASDTWALGVVLASLLLRVAHWPYGDERLVNHTHLMRAKAVMIRHLPCEQLTYGVGIVCLQTALGQGALPPLTSAYPVSAAMRRDTERLVRGPMRSYVAHLRAALERADPLAVSLLRHLLAWESIDDAHPAFHALAHAYFAPLRTPAPAAPKAAPACGEDASRAAEPPSREGPPASAERGSATRAAERHEWYRCNMHPLPGSGADPRHDKHVRDYWHRHARVMKSDLQRLMRTPAELAGFLSNVAAETWAAQQGLPLPAAPPQAASREIAPKPEHEERPRATALAPERKRARIDLHCHETLLQIHDIVC
jgi:serine/threonine protein kinase